MPYFRDSPFPRPSRQLQPNMRLELTTTLLSSPASLTTPSPRVGMKICSQRTTRPEKKNEMWTVSKSLHCESHISWQSFPGKSIVSLTNQMQSQRISSKPSGCTTNRVSSTKCFGMICCLNVRYLHNAPRNSHTTTPPQDLPSSRLRKWPMSTRI